MKSTRRAYRGYPRRRCIPEFSAASSTVLPDVGPPTRLWPQDLRLRKPESGRLFASKRFLTVCLLGFGLALGSAQTAAGSPEAEELLLRFDRNEVSSSTHAVGSISVDDRFGRKISGFESWSLGRERSLVVFTAGEEKGQKILRLGESLYISYPEADKPVKIQGAALRDSVAGSDFSYEDMAGEPGFASRYTAGILGQESRGGVECTILELTANRPGLAYPYLRIWVGNKDFSGWKIEKYSQNRRILKTQEVQSVTLVAGRTVPTRMVMIDHRRGQSRTIFELGKIELDVKVDPKLLTLEELTW